MRSAQLLALLVAGLVAAASAFAQNLPTYQGELRDAEGALISGPISVRFSLFDAPTGGVLLQQGTRSGLNAERGRFTTTLPFDQGFYGRTSGLWVEVAVSQGGGPFTTLSPRQPLAAAPVAMSLPGLTVTRDFGTELLTDVSINLSGSTFTLIAGQGAWQSLTCVTPGGLRVVRPSVVSVSDQPITCTLQVHLGEGVAAPPVATATFVIPPGGAAGDVELPEAIPLVAGDRYTVRLSGPFEARWFVAVGDAYPGGMSSLGSFVDYGLSSFVSPRTGVPQYAFAGRVDAPMLVTTGDIVSGGELVADSLDTGSAKVTSLTTEGPVAVGGLTAVSVSTQTANASNRLSIGGDDPTTRLSVRAGAIGTGWLAQFGNTSVGNQIFRTGGLRQSDAGFLEMTNSVGGANFARLNGTGAWTAVSDARLKTDIEEADRSAMLDAVLKLRPVHFHYQREATHDGPRHLGFLAQDVRALFPQFVTDDGSTLTLDYAGLSTVALGATRKVAEEVRELRAELVRRDRENSLLRERVERLERRLGAEPTTSDRP